MKISTARHARLSMAAMAMTTLVVAAAGAPTAAADTTLQSVNLSCSDGTNLGLSLDLASVNALTDAVNAMTLFPAGEPPLACGLSQDPLLQSTTTSPSTGLSLSSPKRKTPIRARAKRRAPLRKLSGSNPKHDYAVGGGQITASCGVAVQKQTYGISAHVDAGTTAMNVGGTFNVTFQNTPGCPSGSFTAKVDCLDVTGTNAEFTAKIANSNETQPGFTALFAVGAEIAIAVNDGGSTDSLLFNNAGSSCAGASGALATLTSGNINVNTGA